MKESSSTAEQAVNDLALRHGFSPEAVMHMAEAVARGHGRMAQFDHPEFGGSGQWMSGGMTMVSNLFDDALKARVAALCADLAPMAGNMFVQASPAGSAEWWPPELGTPTSRGAQNDQRYAYFADARRLAVQAGGEVTIYDTLDHRLGGFSQQQSRGGSLTFHSRSGTVDLASLPVVSGGVPSNVTPAETRRDVPGAGAATPTGDPLAAIEKLADLHARGILTDEEFAAKKAELLRRV